jgi:Lon protease-like protein
MDDRRMELPLFPLNTVLCPGIALPLHVFEDRYRAMVRHCLETQSPFGVVLIRQGREVGAGTISFTGIGTIAEIRDAGSYDDGRYDLLVVGTRRFEIRQVLSGRRPYLVAEVNLLDETVADEVTAHRLAMTATRRFVTYLELLQPRSGETARSTSASRSRPRRTTTRPTSRAGPRAASRTLRRSGLPPSRARVAVRAGQATATTATTSPKAHAADGSRSPTTRRSCRTCSPGSSRSSRPAVRPCSRRRRRRIACAASSR